MQTLDLRQLEPGLRQGVVHERFRALGRGDVLELVDHRALHSLQLALKLLHGGAHEWKELEKGPLWRALLSRR